MTKEGTQSEPVTGRHGEMLLSETVYSPVLSLVTAGSAVAIIASVPATFFSTVSPLGASSRPKETW